MKHEEIIIVHENFLARTMFRHPPQTKQYRCLRACSFARATHQVGKDDPKNDIKSCVIVLVEFTFQTSVKSLDIIRRCEKC